MISPKNWARFENDNEKLAYLKRLELIPKTQNYVQRFIYSGPYLIAPKYCEVVGYEDKYSLVILIDDELHCIHPDYLAEMQTGMYRLPEEYVVLDLETTGLSPKRDKIIEFAGVKFRNNIEIDSFSTLINPECDLSPLAEAINGISSDMVAEAPCLKDALPKIREFIADIPIVAHNSPFDAGFIQVAYNTNSWTFDNKVIDTLKLSRNAFPTFENHKLSTLKQQLHIKIDIEHRALPDVYATSQLFIACVTTLNSMNAMKKEGA